MKINVNFEESNQEMHTELNETSKEMQVSFGDKVVVQGGEGSGENGATFYPSVSADGVISWTNDRGLSNPPSVNIKGADGKDGINGKDGKDGKDGYAPIKGVDYFDGKDGKDGYTPKKGVDYFDGKDGADGKNGTDGKDGANGKDGADGYTPIKGTDYFTEAEKQEMINSVIAALPIYNGEVVAE